MGVAQKKAQELHAAIDDLTLPDMEQVLDFIAYLKSRSVRRGRRWSTEAERQRVMSRAIDALAEQGVAELFGEAGEWQREVRLDRPMKPFEG